MDRPVSEELHRIGVQVAHLAAGAAAASAPLLTLPHAMASAVLEWQKGLSLARVASEEGSAHPLALAERVSAALFHDLAGLQLSLLRVAAEAGRAADAGLRAGTGGEARGADQTAAR